MAETQTRCGYVAIVGAPNAGKSTLVNALVGSKVSIVTPKVQTTRFRVLGIAVRDAAQIVYVDTPGIFAPKRRLDRAMVHAAWQGAGDADRVVLVVDAASWLKGKEDETLPILERLAASSRSAIVAVNKVDVVPKPKLLTIADRLSKVEAVEAIFMISALSGDGVRDLEAYLISGIPEGPWLYPEDQIADMPERLLAAEITREQLFLQLRQELPYALAVETEDWKEQKDGGARIEQTIYVQRESQKPIVLGEGGRRIKAVGAAARAELASLLGRPVHLFLTVKVRETWQDDPRLYRDLGLEYDA